MRTLVAGLVACAFFVGVSDAQNLDSVCFVEDLPMLLESGVLLDTGGLLDDIDTVVINGGDCDSVSATVYLTGVLFGIPVTAVKMNSCSVHVLVAGGMLGDTVVNVCPASVLPPVAGRRAAPRAGAVLRVAPLLSGIPLCREARVYNLDGTLVGASGRGSAAGSAAGVKVLIHRQPEQ